MFNEAEEASDPFMYFGLGLSQDIILSQKDYTSMLQTVTIDRPRTRTSQFSLNKRPLIEVKKLLWLA